jgi:hypothetical protein
MRVGGQRHAPAALPPIPIVQEAGWAAGQSGRVQKYTVRRQIGLLRIETVKATQKKC